jgi:hypothetical protein
MAADSSIDRQVEVLRAQQEGLDRTSEQYRIIQGLIDDLINKQKELLDFQVKRIKEIEREVELLNDVNNKAEIASKARQAEALLKQTQLQTEKELLKLSQQKDVLDKARAELEKVRDLTDADALNRAQEEYNLALAQYDILNKEVEKLKEKEKFQKAGVDSSLNLINALGIRTEEQDNSMTRMFRGILRGGEDAKNVFEGFSAGLKKINLENITLSLLSKTIESTIYMVKQADQTFASFNKTIGTTGELNNEIYNLSTSNALLGFTLDETAKSYTALASGFVDFRGLTQEQRLELAQVTAELQAIGISADVSTKNISLFSKAMGLSTSEAVLLSKELVAVAGALEMAPSKISSDFAAAASTLIVYGDRSIEVFKGLESAVKASGVEINNLISIASKMDTFQGAAEAAGKLNAVLGGNLLNSSELLMASEEQRIRLIVEAVQSQGVQFNELDRYTQKAIANAAGITDMAEANKLFGMSLDAYDDYVSKTAMSSEEQANLEERINASKSAQEKFTYIMQAFAIAVMPILNFITFLIDGFMKLNDSIGGILPELITFSLLFLKLGGWITSVGGWLAGLASSAGALAPVFGTIAGGITSLGAAIAGVLTGPVIAAIAVIVAAIGFVYTAFFNTNSSLYKFMENNKILASIIKIVLGPIFGLVGLFHDLYKGTLTTAKAFDYLLGILQYINPIFYFAVGALRALITVLTQKNSPALHEMGDVLASSFSKFANVLISLVKPALDLITLPLRTVGSLMSGLLKGVDAGMDWIASKFSGENVVGIKMNVDSTTELAKASSSVTPENINTVKQIASEVQKFNMELKTMATITASEPLEKLVKAITGQTNAIVDNAEQAIILKVGDLEIGRVIGNFITRKGNIDTIVKSVSSLT